MVARKEGVFVDAQLAARVRHPPGAEAARELGLPAGVAPPERWQLRTIRVSVPGMQTMTLSGVWRACCRARVHLRTARPRPYSPDPDYTVKRQWLLALLAEAGRTDTKTVVVFLDEMGFARWPQPARTFAAAAPLPPPRTRPQGREAKSRIGGMLDAVSGRVLYVEHRTVGRERLLQLYRKLAATYPDQTISVVQDNWSIHAHADLDAYLATVPRIQRVWLPIAASWLNPIEKLWRKLRQEVLRLHRQATDWKALRRMVCTFLDQFAGGSAQLLHEVGLTGSGALAQALHPTTDLRGQK
jgi:transposase